MSQFVYGAVPTSSIKRNWFNLSHNHQTTGNLGDIIPLGWEEVLPGDVWKQDVSAIIRTSSPLVRPVMGDLYLDLYSFFIPNRILYDGWEGVFGNPNPSQYSDEDYNTVPSFGYTSSSNYLPGGIADHLGLPKLITGGQVLTGLSVLPFRAYAMTYNEWFRNQNVCDEVYVQKGSTHSSESLNSLAFGPNNYFGALAKASKIKDLFTSCLPKPQKGDSSNIELALSGYGEVYASNTINSKYVEDSTVSTSLKTPTGVTVPNGNLYSSYGSMMQVTGTYTGSNKAVIANYKTDLASGTASGSFNVNDLRTAIALQKRLERSARIGDRYREYLLGAFGIHNADSRMQVPEFLAGQRINLNIEQVVQSNTQVADEEGNVESPLGNLGAFSLSGVSNSCKFKKSITEHGIIMTLAIVRQRHIYSQGVAKSWKRISRDDFYDPIFANLGEQPIYKRELFAGAGDGVFGYNEAWVHYRSIPNQVSGQLRHNIPNTQAIWTLSDNYLNAPSLTSSFIEETKDYLGNVLTASNSLDQFIFDFYFKVSALRPMPTYSIPGRMDHTYH